MIQSPICQSVFVLFLKVIFLEHRILGWQRFLLTLQRFTSTVLWLHRLCSEVSSMYLVPCMYLHCPSGCFPESHSLAFRNLTPTCAFLCFYLARGSVSFLNLYICLSPSLVNFYLLFLLLFSLSHSVFPFLLRHLLILFSGPWRFVHFFFSVFIPLCPGYNFALYNVSSRQGICGSWG